jgi:hypothetical protein
MGTKNIYLALIICITSLMVVNGCAVFGGENYKFYNNRDTVENNTPTFNPTYLQDKERQHMAVFFDIVDGELKPSSKPAELRPAKIPYRSKTAGSVFIIYKGADGKELGRYATEDPILVRSCDFDKGKLGELKAIEKGTVEILLPYNPLIKTVDIRRINGKPRTYDFSRQIKMGIERKK